MSGNDEFSHHPGVLPMKLRTPLDGWVRRTVVSVV
jgi:hypothetical protein